MTQPTGLTRRFFLGGLLTLAVIPPLVAANDGLTPLEIAVEDVRRAYLRYMLYGTRETKPLVQAMYRHRELGLSGRDRVLTARLAFRLARRDSRIVRPMLEKEGRGMQPQFREAIERYIQHMMEEPARHEEAGAGVAAMLASGEDGHEMG